MKVNDAVAKTIDLADKAFDLIWKSILSLAFFAGWYFSFSLAYQCFNDGSGSGAFPAAIAGILYLGIGGPIFYAMWDRVNHD